MNMLGRRKTGKQCATERHEIGDIREDSGKGMSRRKSLVLKKDSEVTQRDKENGMQK